MGTGPRVVEGVRFRVFDEARDEGYGNDAVYGELPVREEYRVVLEELLELALAPVELAHLEHDAFDVGRVAIEDDGVFVDVDGLKMVG